MSTIDLAFSPSDLRALAEQSNAWPFEQAKAIVARLKKSPKDDVLFETGYGPSGLPHIGTFGEVARTTMVRHAFRRLSDVPARLFCFSDDMDGLRKVPDNVPNKEMLAAHLGKPLTAVPNPYHGGPFSNEHPSFGAANNAGVQRARHPVTVLLNPDCELLDGSLARLAARAAAGSMPSCSG